MMAKKFIVFISAVLLIAVGLFYYASTLHRGLNRPIIWGITFSSKFSRQLNNDWQKSFKAILNELKPNNIRLIAYWDEIEKNKDVFDFSDFDWQMDEAQKRGVNVILVIGMKVPRWPECHLPDFAKELSAKEREEVLGKYLKKITERYKNKDILNAWQIENEPFLWFGECPERLTNFLSNEIAIVKSIDPTHPVIVTDSGELGLWYTAAHLGDIFGTTMYRRVHSDIFGYVDYHLPSDFFILKEKLIRFLIGSQSKKFIVVELAAEPWLKKQLYETTIEDQFKVFDLEFFRDTIDYAKATGFDEYYLWGAEWWYYLKQNGHPEIWNEAKKLWR